MGREKRARERKAVVLSPEEGWKLKALEGAIQTALRAAEQAAARARAAVAEAVNAKNAHWDTLCRTHQLDPAKSYILDDRTMTLTPAAAPARRKTTKT